MSSRPPNVIVNSGIENSGLLITRTLHPHKHQLRDFFNRHRRYHSLTSFARDSDIEQENSQDKIERRADPSRNAGICILAPNKRSRPTDWSKLSAEQRTPDD